MSIRIGHASIDENGKIVNGKVGDQTGKEICIRKWYSKPWNVYLECTDSTLANKAAEWMEKICNDPNFGYDQNERWTGYWSIKKNGFKLAGAKGEFDCSSLIITCYILAGLEISPDGYTGNLKNKLLKTGKFIAYTDATHLLNDSQAKRGSIYLKEGSHVVMALDRGKPLNPYNTPTTTVAFGKQGTSVKWVQWEINQWLTEQNLTLLKIDGDFGSKTDKAVRLYQEAHNLTIDGRVGPKTRESLIDN